MIGHIADSRLRHDEGIRKAGNHDAGIHNMIVLKHAYFGLTVHHFLKIGIGDESAVHGHGSESPIVSIFEKAIAYYNRKEDGLADLE